MKSTLYFVTFLVEGSCESGLCKPLIEFIFLLRSLSHMIFSFLSLAAASANTI